MLDIDVRIPRQAHVVPPVRIKHVLQRQRRLQRDVLFLAAGQRHGAGILAAMAGVDHHHMPARATRLAARGHLCTRQLFQRVGPRFGILRLQLGKLLGVPPGRDRVAGRRNRIEIEDDPVGALLAGRRQAQHPGHRHRAVEVELQPPRLERPGLHPAGTFSCRRIPVLGEQQHNLAFPRQLGEQAVSGFGHIRPDGDPRRRAIAHDSHLRDVRCSRPKPAETQ